jgi:hypothetical protein
MRMWNINPRKLCKKHLVAEHGEIHAAIGNLKKSRKWAEALTSKGYLEPQNMLSRHNKLVKEMLKRGIKHKSPLNTKNVKLPIGKINKQKSIKDLKKRCKKCRKLLK